MKIIHIALVVLATSLLDSCAATRSNQVIDYNGDYRHLVKRERGPILSYLSGDVILNLHNDSVFSFTIYDTPSHFNKYTFSRSYGEGTWQEHQDFIVLSFKYIESPCKETNRAILGYTYMERMNMIVDKKGKDRLILNGVVLKRVKYKRYKQK